MEDTGVGGRIVVRCIFTEMCCEGIDWMDLSQDRESCRALVNILMDIRVL